MKVEKKILFEKFRESLDFQNIAALFTPWNLPEISHNFQSIFRYITNNNLSTSSDEYFLSHGLQFLSYLMIYKNKF